MIAGMVQMTWRLSSCDQFVGFSWTSVKLCRPTGCTAPTGFTELQSAVIDRFVNIVINKRHQVLTATGHKISSQ